MRGIAAAGLAIAATALSLGSGCGNPPPGRTFYERTIEPILTQSCSRGTGPCHQADADDPFGAAAGNFDVSSFENVQKRRDLLQRFGPYPVAGLLIKAAGQGGQEFSYNGESRDLQVVHVGGANLTVTSTAYLQLATWIRDGATENGVAPPTPPQDGDGACSTVLPPGFDAAPYLSDPTFDTFDSDVEPILEASGCNSGSCHGAPQADFYITCGDTQEQVAFNFSQAWAFVNDSVEDSQILRVPLAVAAGGGPHTGGDQFDSRDEDPDYLAIKAWAEAAGSIPFGEGDPGRQFFADNVQPLLVARGCLFAACHSPGASNDFKLRSGSQGFFSAIALEKNYTNMKNEFMAMEFPDARRSRAVAKGIIPSSGGISHRGGFVLEGGGTVSDPANCGAFDPATSSAFCTIQEWVNVERAAMAGAVLPLGNGDTLPIVYVSRQATHVADPLDVETYQANSDLLVATATLGAGGAVTAMGAGTSLLGGCAGANPTTADVRSPDVRFDGNRVVFAMRTSATDRMSIWAVDLDGSNCTRITNAQADENGLEKHDVDPAWSPDGDWIVFASSRGGADGPTKSRAKFFPQTDLWRMHEDGSGLEQMTFLTNSEISPQFMREGRTTMTTEKVSEDFYQLAGRRQNWDLTDYHPLLAQRAESPYADPQDPSAVLPSVDYQRATDIREGADGNFLIILSDDGVKGGAGTLATFNRSIGPFEMGRSDPSFLKSMVIIDSAATGRAGSATTGAYRNPTTLPDGRILVSYAAFSGDLATATSLDWDLVAISPINGQRQVLVGGAGAVVDAVPAMKYPPREMYLNRRQLVFGGGIDTDLGSHGIIHMPDAPMVFTLLTGNLRRGRPVEAFRDARSLRVWRENPMPGSTPDLNDGIFEDRDMLGEADLRGDGSVKIRIPSGTPVVLELVDGSGNTVVTMTEEHQVGAGETISMGVVEDLFDAVCGGCHGSVSGNELDVHVTPDALTGASQSLSAGQSATNVGN
jgi:hypothetical protein